MTPLDLVFLVIAFLLSFFCIAFANGPEWLLELAPYGGLTMVIYIALALLKVFIEWIRRKVREP